jgi:hypothetical protein
MTQLEFLVCSFPFLDTFSLELVGFATRTLLRCLAALKEMRIDLAWSRFDASNCPPCKVVRSRSARAAISRHQSST